MDLNLNYIPWGSGFQSTRVRILLLTWCYFGHFWSRTFWLNIFLRFDRKRPGPVGRLPARRAGQLWRARSRVGGSSGTAGYWRWLRVFAKIIGKICRHFVSGLFSRPLNLLQHSLDFFVLLNFKNTFAGSKITVFLLFMLKKVWKYPKVDPEAGIFGLATVKIWKTPHRNFTLVFFQINWRKFYLLYQALFYLTLVSLNLSCIEN